MITYQIVFYRASANWYIRFVKFEEGKVWDKNADSLSLTTTWLNSAIALTFSAIIGGHPIAFPTNLPLGTYDMLFYNAAIPAVSDIVQVGKRIVYIGNSLSELPQDL